MALSAARELDHYVDLELRSFAVAAATTIYKGALVGLKSDGYARGLVAADPFAGIAYETGDNSTGSDGDIFGGHGNSYVGTAIDVRSSGMIILRLDPAGRLVKTIVHQVEDLAAGADIAARSIHCFDSEGWITAVRITNQASAASGVDAGNTSVMTVAINAGTVASETFDNVRVFPPPNTTHDFGVPANAQAAAADVATLAVFNGATADLPAFLLEVDYV